MEGSKGLDGRNFYAVDMLVPHFMHIGPHISHSLVKSGDDKSVPCSNQLHTPPRRSPTLKLHNFHVLGNVSSVLENDQAN